MPPPTTPSTSTSNFLVPRAETSTTLTPSISSSPIGGSKTTSSNAGLIVGIVIGSLILVGLIVGIIVSEMRRRKVRRSRKAPSAMMAEFFRVKAVEGTNDTSFGSAGAAPLLYYPPNSSTSSSKMEEFNPYGNSNGFTMPNPHPSPSLRSPDFDNEAGALLSHSRKRSLSDTTITSLPLPLPQSQTRHTPESRPSTPQRSPIMQESTLPPQRSPIMQESTPTSSSTRTLSRLLIPEPQQHSAVTATNYASRHPIATVDSVPSSAASLPDDVSESSFSMYSQGSASTRQQRRIWDQDTNRSTPPPPPVPRIPEQYRTSSSTLEDLEEDGDEELEDGTTGKGRSSIHVVGELLKARARRGGGPPLTRSSTKVSHIERAGSIRSVAITSDSDGDYLAPNPTSSYPHNNHHNHNGLAHPHPMETLTELPSAVSSTFPNPFKSAMSSRTPSSVSTIALTRGHSNSNMLETTVSQLTPTYSSGQDPDVKSLRPDEVVMEGMVRPLNIRKSNASSLDGHLYMKNKRSF